MTSKLKKIGLRRLAAFIHTAYCLVPLKDDNELPEVQTRKGYNNSYYQANLLRVGNLFLTVQTVDENLGVKVELRSIGSGDTRLTHTETVRLSKYLERAAVIQGLVEEWKDGRADP